MTSSWKTDSKRDMLSFRFIELSISLIESVLVDNEKDMQKYNEWLSLLSGKNAEGIKINEPKPSILAEINPTRDTSVKLLALPSEANFAVEFKTPVFSAVVSIIYDFARFDINLATIVDFDGNAVLAISWAEDFMTKIDKMRLNIS